MTTKQEITNYINNGDYAQILACAEISLSRTLRYVQMHIWGDDRLLPRWRAIEALGLLASRFASENDEDFRNLIRRCLWAMNDESGNVPWAAPEVMASIIQAAPKQYAEFIPLLVTNGLENEMCHKGTLWAVGYLGADFYDALAPFLPQLMPFLHHQDAELRGYGLWALARCAYQPAAAEINGLKDDPAQCLLYHDGQLEWVTIAAMAAKYLA